MRIYSALSHRSGKVGFYDYALESMRHLFEALLYGWQKTAPIFTLDTS
jgi:hypothetical protein